MRRKTDKERLNTFFIKSYIPRIIELRLIASFTTFIANTYQKLYSANNWIATPQLRGTATKDSYQKLYSANNWIATTERNIDIFRILKHQKLYSANNWIATKQNVQLYFNSGYQKLYSANNWIATSFFTVYKDMDDNQKLYSANNWIATLYCFVAY